MPEETTPLPKVVGDGSYVLGDLLGEGGGGVVYRAVGPEGDCAVKLRLVPERPIQAARFLVESVPMSKIRHPNVVKVYETGKEQGYYWIAMELFRNGTLRDLVKRVGKVELDASLRVTEEVLAGLHSIHEAGYIHRDIKPLNIFLNDIGCAAIGDFGVARHLHSQLWFRTRTGQAIGTMGYRAPEQDHSAKDASRPADIYGVAATLYFLVTGTRPPLLYASDAQPDLLDPLPEIVRPLVSAATGYEPEDRYATAELFRQDVRRVRNEVRKAAGRPPVADDDASGSGLRQWLRRLIG